MVVCQLGHGVGKALGAFACSASYTESARAAPRWRFEAAGGAQAAHPAAKQRVVSVAQLVLLERKLKLRLAANSGHLEATPTSLLWFPHAPTLLNPLVPSPCLLKQLMEPNVMRSRKTGQLCAQLVPPFC